jgi:hypothetical protein
MRIIMSVTTSTAVVKAPERTPEEIQFESTKQAVLNKSMELQKQALKLCKPELSSMPSHLLENIFCFVPEADLSAIAGTCKTLQFVMCRFCLKDLSAGTFQDNTYPGGISALEGNNTLKKCGMNIPPNEIFKRVVHSAVRGPKEDLDMDPTKYLELPKKTEKATASADDLVYDMFGLPISERTTDSTDELDIDPSKALDNTASK